MRRVLTLALTMTACGLLLHAQQQEDADKPTKPLVPVAASTLAGNPDAFVGEFVSLAGTVDQSFSKLAFSMDQDLKTSTGQDVLVLMPALHGDMVELNTYVTVIGEVVRFDPEEAAKAKLAPDLPAEIAAKYRGRPAVMAMSVINPAGVDVTKRLPPPMTEDEIAYQKIMKQVASANGALRKAIEGSDPKLAREQTATLKKMFSETEAFWREKRRSDAAAWSVDARKLSETIDKAAAAAKWDEAKTAAATLGKACQTCHATYRERFDDGSFRIKLQRGL